MNSWPFTIPIHSPTECRRPPAARLLRLCCLMLLSYHASGAGAGEAPEPPPPTQYLVQRWTVSDGLPESKMLGVAQTPDGFLWCVSDNYLVRFDGRKFETVVDEASVQALGRIKGFRGVAVDGRGLLWVLGEEGAGCWTGSQWQIVAGRQFDSLARSEGERNWFQTQNGLALVEDGQAHFFPVDTRIPIADNLLPYAPAARTGPIDIWLTRSRHLYRFRNGQYRAEAYPLPGERRAQVVHAGPRRLWLGCGEKIAWHEAGGWNFLPPLSISAIDYLCCLHESRDGTLWVGTRRSVYRWQGERWEEMVREDPGFPLGVWGIHEDAAGNLWMACHGGLLCLKKRIIQVLGDAAIQCAWERQNGEVWIAAAQDVVTTHAAPWPLAGLGLPDKILVTAMLLDRQGILWIGSQGDGLFRIEAGRSTRILPAPNITALCEDGQGQLWVGVWTGLMRYDRQRRYLHMTETMPMGCKTTLLWKDSDGAIWAGLQGHGLMRMAADQTTQTWSWPGAGIPGGEIYDMLRDARGTLWIAGNGGLARWGADGTRVVLTAQQGLAGTAVRQLASDRQGGLWLGTRIGIQRIPLADLDAVAAGQKAKIGGIVLGRDAGIPEPACLGGFRSDQDRADRDVLWFPTASGLVRIEPARVAAACQAPVQIYLDSIWTRGLLLHQLRGVLPGSGLEAAGPLELSVRTRPIEFHFGAAAPGRAEPPQFTCRMTGLDKDWSAVGAARSISYPALPAGRYQFEVAIPPECGGTDQTRAAIDLIVRPVFWQTGWFYGMMLLASSGLAAVLARGVLQRRYLRRMLELRHEQALQLERARIARDMHDRIGAGLTSLAMVSDLAQAEGDFPPAANEQFNRIFHLARELADSLDEIVWAVNPANDTLQNLVAYLVGMATEYLEALPTRLSIDVPEALPSMSISSRERHEICLTVKEALANAIKHARARQITFVVRWLDGELLVVVTDDGQGFDTDRPDAAASGQDGLRNMRARMDAVGGRIGIQSHPGQGTQVALSLKMMTPDRGKRMVTLPQNN